MKICSFYIQWSHSSPVTTHARGASSSVSASCWSGSWEFDKLFLWYTVHVTSAWRREHVFVFVFVFCLGTIIYFFVSRPGSMSKPMLGAEKEAKPSNMNTRTHTCSPISHYPKMTAFSVGFYYLYWKSRHLAVDLDALQSNTVDLSRACYIRATVDALDQSRRCENEQRAGWETASAGPKTEGTKLFCLFFLTWPWKSMLAEDEK